MSLRPEVIHRLKRQLNVICPNLKSKFSPVNEKSEERNLDLPHSQSAHIEVGEDRQLTVGPSWLYVAYAEQRKKFESDHQKQLFWKLFL